MQTLTIEAASRESAQGLHDALAAFRVQLWEGKDGTCRVEVTLGAGDREIVEVLNAIEAYVTARHAGAAHIKLNGHDYTLHEALPPPVLEAPTESPLGSF